MSIVKAYVLPHPPLAVLASEQKQQIKATLSAFEKISAEIAAIAPETIIIITPHSVVYSDYFHISPGDSASGSFARFGAPETVVQADYNTDLAGEITRVSEARGIPAGTLGEKDPDLDHGTTVPLWFINQAYADYKLVRISQSAMEPAAHYRLGQAIAEAVANVSTPKTVLIASGDLSHKLTDDGPYGFAKEGPEFDKHIVQALASGDFLSIFNTDDNLRERAAECGYNSIMILAGTFDGKNVSSDLVSYEGPLGVGYAVSSFEPRDDDPSRNILAQYEEAALERQKKLRQSEDHYQALARKSLEHIVQSEDILFGSAKHGGVLPVPENLPSEMINTQAGVFVSLHKNGRLRGCIGTIAPTTDNIAQEIIQNAINAGLKDSRFDPVTADELPLLTYKVDVLSAPESIPDASFLDVLRYGVIVASSAGQRGLLLPNLDGVDTVEQQIAIAMQKAGITSDTPVELERFEVVRHG